MGKKFTENQVLRFIGRLANKVGTGHESITKVLDKLEKFLEKHSERIDFLGRVKLMVEMLKAHSNQDFIMDEGAVGMIVAGLTYLILPTDIVPDFIIGVGFADDAVAIGLVLNQINSEVERYKQWKQTIDSEVIDIEIAASDDED